MQNTQEIELSDLFKAFWDGKLQIAIVTLLVTILSVVAVLELPNIYRAEVVVSPADSSGANSLGAMASQLGGLASIAGVQLGSSGGGEVNIALATLKSRQLITKFIRENQLEVKLLAVEGWDQESGELIIDPDVYSVETLTWNPERRPETQGEPTDWELYKAFSKLITVESDKKTGLIKISVNYYSPELAQEWVMLLLSELNSWMKNKKILEAKNNISYMEGKLKETTLSEMHNIFYQIIEDQTKELMLASVSNEFVFKVIDPAVIPEEKFEPKRSVIVAISFMVAFMLSTIIVLIRSVAKFNVRKQKND